jgi:hypothetical protein
VQLFAMFIQSKALLKVIERHPEAVEDVLAFGGQAWLFSTRAGPVATGQSARPPHSAQEPS